MHRRFFALFFMLCFVLCCPVVSFAQKVNQSSNQGSRWVFGGEFGLGFSTYGANISISPIIGYRITPKWEAGTRLTYNYFSYQDFGTKVSTNNFGGGLYTVYEIYQGIFAQFENEILSYDKVYYNPVYPDQLIHDRIIIHSIFIGGGYRQHFSENGFMSLTVLYNLNESLDTPYANPLFRIGFGFGL